KTLDTDMITSSTQHVDQRKQHDPDQIDHVPIQHPGFKAAAVVGVVQTTAAALGQPAEDDHAEHYVEKVEPGEDPVEGEKGVVLHAQPRAQQVVVLGELQQHIDTGREQRRQKVDRAMTGS